MHKHCKLAVLTLLSSQSILLSQDQLANKQDIVSLLERTYDLDQSKRVELEKCIKLNGHGSKEYYECLKLMNEQDSINQKITFDIIDKYGWISNKKSSAKATRAIFYLIQHAPLAAQLKYSDLIEDAFKKNEISAFDYFIFVDRLKVRQGKNQIYGTQSAFDHLGNLYLYPIQDTTKANALRQAADLPPLSQHIKTSGIRYAQFPKIDPKKDVLLIGHVGNAENRGIEGMTVWFNSIFMGQSDKNGFFLISIPKKPDEKITLCFEKNGIKAIDNYVIEGQKDFFEIYLLIK